MGILDDLGRYNMAALFFLPVEKTSVQRERVPEVIVAREEAQGR